MMFEDVLEFAFEPETVGFTEREMFHLHEIALQMEMIEGVSIKGWGVPEIPDVDTYCFYNMYSMEAFDVIFIDDVLVPHFFRDTPLITPESVNLYPTTTIADAIERYEFQ